RFIMRPELQAQLLSRHKKIFAQWQLSTPSCGDGWFPLIDSLCRCLQFHTDHGDGPQIVALQIKEKLGSLRFYCHQSDDFQQGIITLAVQLSEQLCKTCGTLILDKHHCPGCNPPP
ncbi:hypothetical protein A11A3_11398, partial [Alcanivorax hongdengensis A-11-3]